MTASARPEIVLIAAVGENDVIGSDGDMPWKLSTDLKRFKRLTLGHPVVMGRKTFESIGRPLPGRRNIVVTRDAGWAHEGVARAGSLDEAFALAGETAGDAVMVIGGGTIYSAALPMADRLEITRVHAAPAGDTLFPKIDPQLWQEVARETPPRGEKDTADVTFLTFRRCTQAPSR
ncbi:dihydrofolate reductase [Stappia sp. 28M-7]|uniref:dihydrofolate reductase n=1 Tax=Stappia sp. 28M-7 TaxID=2762596 RepID=UPI00163CE184|nr:dihydrofolate reductase [Stappia sp. 28M-7]MBC2860418.1 dihydrofolate reductase [Stappia sp. 28M-7]